MHKAKPISVLGVVNAGILSIVGYLAYRNWDSPNWDRRAVSAASVCLLALWGSEMCVFIIDHHVSLLTSFCVAFTSVRNREVPSNPSR